MAKRIDTSAIKTVYTGKAGKCCCGCAGNHTSNPAVVQRVARILIENAAAADMGDGYASVDIGARTYVAYVPMGSAAEGGEAMRLDCYSIGHVAQAAAMAEPGDTITTASSFARDLAERALGRLDKTGVAVVSRDDAPDEPTLPSGWGEPGHEED